MPPLSIAIAGCGVAGLAFGALAARAGHCVAIFDRLETPRPIGSGLILQPVGLAVLDEIGAGAAIRELGAPINRLFGRVQPSNRVVLDVRYASLGKRAGAGLAVHRGALFHVLHQAAVQAGVDLAPGQEIVAQGDGRLVFRGGVQSASFDLVVDALGVRSVLARSSPPTPLPYGALWANLNWSGPFDPAALEQRYLHASRMVGVLPIGRLPGETTRHAAFFWSLRRSDHDAWRARGLAEWKAEVLGLWPETAPLIDQIASPDDLIFANYAHATLGSPVGARLAHIGDSWHCASPQLGQGANMALLDALALARALERRTGLDDALAAYAQARRTHIRLYQLASWMFTPAYQSDSLLLAGLRDWLLAPVSRIWPAPPLLAGLVSGVIGSPVAAIDALGDG